MDKIEETRENGIGYQFNADPTYLMACCDKNCRSLLWTLIQLSYMADKDGWFFRSMDDLRAQSFLGEKVVRECISTFHKIGLLEVKCELGKGKTPNYYKLNVDKFKEWESIKLDECYKNPKNWIQTDDYKTKGRVVSYLCNDSSVEVQQSVQSADNIDNIDNKENILSEGSKQVEVKSNQFEEYKKREDYLMDKLYHVSTWTDFKLIRKQIRELISTAASDKVAEKTKKRYSSIEEGKVKFLKSKISKEPYNSFYDDFYREYNCGWLGMENSKSVVQPQQKKEDDPNADIREIFRINGWGEPDGLSTKQQNQEGQEFHPIDDDEDNLPF